MTSAATVFAHRLARAAALAVLATTAACLPALTAESTAPPGRAARLDPVNGFWSIKSYRLELSQGVAIAVSCSDGGPCEQLTAASDNAAIAEVRPAALQTLQASGFGPTRNQQPASAVVIIGKAPGTTTIRLRSKAGDREVRVTVIPPAAPV